jgi:uncharacterized membrane protein (UPF0127 family)
VFLTVRNETRGQSVAGRVRAARTFRERVVGLLATPRLGAGEGLWISPCQAIHTFGMRYPIDIAFLDAEGVVRHQATVKPWRLSAWVRKTVGVLELAEGELAKSGTQAGDKLVLVEAR